MCWLSFILYAVLLIVVCIAIKRFLLEKIRLSKLDEKLVFITGCDSGFGRSLVMKLVQHNIPTLAGCFTDEGRAELESAVAEKTLSNASEAKQFWTLKIDVRNSETLENARKFVETELHHLNLWAVVCNAGVGQAVGPDDFLSCDSDYAATIDVNALGVVRTCHAFKRLVKLYSGRFIIMSSMTARMPLPYLGPYNMSKYAVEGYADTLRMEMRYFGCSVHIIQPGFYCTSLTNFETVKKNYEKTWARLGQDIKDEYGEDFMEQLLRANKQSLDKWSGKSVDPVVDAYFSALTSRFPRNRYVIGWDAHLMAYPLSVVPCWVRDFFIAFMMSLENTPVPKNIGEKTTSLTTSATCRSKTD